uniref:Uncharacterized protein n=1 Tax=Rhizophora mucronata TaxID=61149 RepID=A0A2P2IV84_RHIMU
MTLGRVETRVLRLNDWGMQDFALIGV